MITIAFTTRYESLLLGWHECHVTSPLVLSTCTHVDKIYKRNPYLLDFIYFTYLLLDRSTCFCLRRHFLNSNSTQLLEGGEVSFSLSMVIQIVNHCVHDSTSYVSRMIQAKLSQLALSGYIFSNEELWSNFYSKT